MIDSTNKQKAINVLNSMKFDVEYCTEYGKGYNDGIDSALSLFVLLTEQPERKKGKWIVDERRFGNMERHCSLCGAILEGVDWKWRNNYYCYHCGAEMEADDETN